MPSTIAREARQTRHSLCYRSVPSTTWSLTSHLNITTEEFSSTTPSRISVPDCRPLATQLILRSNHEHWASQLLRSNTLHETLCHGADILAPTSERGISFLPRRRDHARHHQQAKPAELDTLHTPLAATRAIPLVRQRADAERGDHHRRRRQELLRRSGSDRVR